MAEKMTPEEKLLKLIEGPASDLKGMRAAKKRFKFNVLKSSIKQVFTSAKAKFKSYLFNIKFINQVLMGVSLVLSIYLIFDFIKGKPNLNQVYAYSQQVSRAPKIKPADLEGKILNLSDILSQIDKRDIFHFIPIKKEEKVPPAKEVFNSLVSNLKLVGIIWGKSPQAMIEDKKENKTWLINPGDKIGEIIVRQILRDRVILSYQEYDMELM